MRALSAYFAIITLNSRSYPFSNSSSPTERPSSYAWLRNPFHFLHLLFVLPFHSVMEPLTNFLRNGDGGAANDSPRTQPRTTVASVYTTVKSTYQFSIRPRTLSHSLISYRRSIGCFGLVGPFLDNRSRCLVILSASFRLFTGMGARSKIINDR